MASPQEFFGGTQNQEVPGKDQRTRFQRAMGFSHMTEVRGAVRQPVRLYNHSHVYLSPCRTEVHVSNNPVNQKCTEESNLVECQYTGIYAMYTQVER